MAQDVLNLSEESFRRIIDLLSQLDPDLREQYDRAVKQITALAEDWNDEDHREFLESFKEIENELDNVSSITVQMITETRQKLEMIQARRNIQL